MWDRHRPVSLQERYKRASPDSVLSGLSRGCFVSGGLLAAVVAYDFVDLNDDVLWDAGFYGIAIDYLGEVDTLFIGLSDRHLAENFIFASNYNADEITRNIFLP